MAEAREIAEWNRASQLMCLFVNCNIDTKKTTPFSPADFNPYSKKSRDRAANDQADEIIFKECEREKLRGVVKAN